MRRQVVPLVRPLASRWRPVGAPLEPRCATTENAPYLHSVHIITRLFLSQRGGVHPPPPIKSRLAPPAPILSGTRSGTARGDSTRRGRSSPFMDHRSRNTGHLFPCLHEPSFRVIPSLFSSCRCIDRCIDRCIEGLWQVSEWTRGGNPGRDNESMRVKENEMKMKRIRLNLPNRGMLVYLPCSGRRYKLEHSGANHCEGV